MDDVHMVQSWLKELIDQIPARLAQYLTLVAPALIDSHTGKVAHTEEDSMDSCRLETNTSKHAGGKTICI